MIKFAEWLQEYDIATGAQVPSKTSYMQQLKNWDSKVKQIKQKLVKTTPGESDFDPQEEEVYASFIHAVQSLLDVLDQDRSDVDSIQEGLSMIQHHGQTYVKYLKEKST